MRLLMHAEPSAEVGTELNREALHALYERSAESWLRVNMVSTVDGAATGANGVTGSINNPADKLVFDLLREQADALVVGAGTLRIEKYGAPTLPLLAVSNRGSIPVSLHDVETAYLVTRAGAPGLAESRELLGEDRTLVVGEDAVDLAELRPVLAERGWRHLLSEGGPHLLGSMLAAGVVDELCSTIAPSLVGGSQGRIVAGDPLDQALRLQHLIEQDGTLLAAWLTAPALD